MHWRDMGVHRGVGVQGVWGRTAMGGCRGRYGGRAGAVCATWDQGVVQGHGTPKLLLSPAGMGGPSVCHCPAWPPCPGTLVGLGVQAAPRPRARVLRAPAVPPCPAAPGTPKPPSRATRVFVPFWGQKGAFRTKEGAEAAVGAAVPSRPVQRQNKPKACPCPCPCPSRVRAHVHGHIHAHAPPRAGVAAGNAPGAATEPLPRWVPVGTPAPRRLGPISAQPRVPPGPRLPLASGRWLFSWKSGGGGSAS